MSSLRYAIKTSNNPLARVARGAVRGARHFTLPVPRVIVLPLVRVFVALRAAYYWLLRVFVCEPFFKAQCARYGTGVRCGTFLHWISGSGDIVLGDNVHVDGKCSFFFASLLAKRPELEIGDNCYINHACSFVVADRITIGRDVMISANVSVADSPGHPLDAARRIAHMPPDRAQVRPVVIGDKVWIGAGVQVLPGVHIGEGAVIGAGTIVTRDVDPYTLVVGASGRAVRSLLATPAVADADARAQAAVPAHSGAA